MVITPTLTYASGTWTLSQKHESMIRTTQRKILHLIVQIKKDTANIKGEEIDKNEDKENKYATDKGTEEGSDQNSNKDQDSDVSFQDDIDEAIDSTEKEEEWIEFIKRSTKEAEEHNGKKNCFLTGRKMDQQIFDWHPGLDNKIKTRRPVGRPRKRLEDDINDYLKPDETKEQAKYDLTINNSWMTEAKKKGRIEEKRRKVHINSDLDPLIIDPPGCTHDIELVIRGDSKIIVDWINGKAKQKKPWDIIDNTQLQLMDWWKPRVELSHRTGDWAAHIFREHNKEVDRWAAYGAKGHVLEWVHDSIIYWSEVKGICGFWDGSCNDNICGAGVIVLLFSPKTGWITIQKKCRPAPGTYSLDAEFGGCAMLIENLNFWLRKGGKTFEIINDVLYSAQFHTILNLSFVSCSRTCCST